MIRLAGNSDHPVINVLSKPGLWVQNLTTKEPDDSMIEVGIKAVEAVFDWKKYLEENLIRPNDESKDVKGEVVLSFFVDKEGRPQNITVVHGLCESADKEAIRLVKEGPKWTPGDLPTRVTVEF